MEENKGQDRNGKQQELLRRMREKKQSTVAATVAPDAEADLKSGRGQPLRALADMQGELADASDKDGVDVTGQGKGERHQKLRAFLAERQQGGRAIPGNQGAGGGKKRLLAFLAQHAAKGGAGGEGRGEKLQAFLAKNRKDADQPGKLGGRRMKLLLALLKQRAAANAPAPEGKGKKLRELLNKQGAGSSSGGNGLRGEGGKKLRAFLAKRRQEKSQEASRPRARVGGANKRAGAVALASPDSQEGE